VTSKSMDKKGTSPSTRREERERGFTVSLKWEKNDDGKSNGSDQPSPRKDGGREQVMCFRHGPEKGGSMGQSKGTGRGDVLSLKNKPGEMHGSLIKDHTPVRWSQEGRKKWGHPRR